MSVRLLMFIVTKSYAGIIRYTGTRDSGKIIMVVLATNFILSTGNIASIFFFSGKYIIPFSIIAIDFFISTFLLIAFRLIVKSIYFEFSKLFKLEKNVIIFGAGDKAITLMRVLNREPEVRYKIKAFLDPDELNINKQLDGITVYKQSSLEKLLLTNEISELIFAQNNISTADKRKITDICLRYKVKILKVPKAKKWINGELSTKQIQKINIEDLLERDTISLDYNKIATDLQGKVVMVTGAAGSIGSEIVRQVSRFDIKKIIAFDQAESPLYELELNLKQFHQPDKYEIVIGDIRDEKRVDLVYTTYRPDIIFHAAAYKHVPMMESNPSEAIYTNVHGTKVIVDAAIKHKVDKFVMISTDKAVNPTNIMGASKRIAEIYTQTLNNLSNTKFITTRFGNVLGSNGSVIPIFRRQIENKETLTVTHPEVTRYFMTIPEACQLVLQAGMQGSGGEIFIFDMGKPVKISDLAKKMIMLSGLKTGTDIEIKYTGLRPGEKLYEELLNDKENTIPTKHSKIMIAEVRKYEKYILREISELISLISSNDNFKIARKMKQIVPEFASKNSIFETLDSKQDIKTKKSNPEPDKEV